jgi:tetratricopeptide (TPR) repeat protein
MSSAPSPDFAAAIQQAFPAWNVAILKEISGGNSGARVLVVDFAPQSALGSTPESDLQPGQFILKLQAEPAWSGQAGEPERHAEAAAKNSDFSRDHIPALRHATAIDGVSLILYEIAGQSLAGCVGADTVDSGSLAHYCGLISDHLLTVWNNAYTLTQATAAAATLRAWLGYRLDHNEAPTLHSLVDQVTGANPVFIYCGRILLNPLWLSVDDIINVPPASVAFIGQVHNDLHPGNVLVDRTAQRRDEYWLIDFALSKEAPLGFDHAYLELSLLLGHLQGAEPQRILTILEALDEPPGTVSAQKVPVADAGILNCVQNLRDGVVAWQQEREPLRADSVAAQFRLARAAAGLNWANKAIAESRRRLALAYAAHAATQYLRTFAPDAWDSLVAGSKATQAPRQITPEWSDVWEQLAGFDSSRAKYLLVSGRLEPTTANLSLALVPWSGIIDLDPASSETGLHASISSTLSRLRSLQSYGKDSIPVGLERGTAWLMANGWPSRFEPVPETFRRWRQEYGQRIRDLCEELRRVAAPLPVRVVVLGTDDLTADYYRALLGMLDESLQDCSSITAVGLPTALQGDPSLSACYLITADEFLSALYQVFGGTAQLDEPTVPGPTGPVNIPLDQLRSLEEDLEIIHSSVIGAGSATLQETFWKGNPPTWADLHANVDVSREIAPRLFARARHLLNRRGNYTVELRHSPGAGGTTVALRCAWDLRRDFPVCVLRRYSRTTADRVDQLFRISQKPVLLVAEASALPPAQREELYREISSRNVRSVILYIVRGLSDVPESDPDKLIVTDPMSDVEANAFYEAFAARTATAQRVRALRELTTSDALRRYRTPFIYGLTTYEEEFERVDRYVASHLATATASLRRVARFLALVTSYTQTGISIGLIKRLLGRDSDAAGDLDTVFADPLSRLTVKRALEARLLHPIIANELLRQTLGGTEDWRYGLKDVSLDLASETVSQLGSDADETLNLLTELFIKRDFWTPGVKRRRNFSELILAMPSAAGQHEVLQRLTELCPEEAHFWNHLGRHHIYEMKQDFAAAETYLLKAVELDPLDRVHHHSLGMVRRFWVRSLIADMLRLDVPPSAVEMLAAIDRLLVGAAENFHITRTLAPDDEHGYITHVQLVIEVLESLSRVVPEGTLAELSTRRDTVGAWARKSQVLAEDLLGRVRHMRQQLTPSKYELRCVNALADLYGQFEELITSLERLDNAIADPDVRRALASAYYSRAGRMWSLVAEHELRRTKEAMEDNLRSEPTNAHDIRTWFQAFRRLPDFSYISAIDRLAGWASGNAVDAYYYLYILHFLRWRGGFERDENLIQENLDQCKQRAIGRRGLSYEWLAESPQWCPIVHASELGEWDKGLDFFQNTGTLAWATGTIATIKPQGGTIRLGTRTIAYFVPGIKFSESRHLNTLVRFHLGFAYDGLRAWSVDFAGVPTVAALDASEPRGISVPGPRSGVGITQEVATVSRATAEQFILELLAKAETLKHPLFVSEVGNQLLQRFGLPPVQERLGFDGLERLLASFASIVVSPTGTTPTVQRSSPSQLSTAARDAILEILAREAPGGRKMFLSVLGDRLLFRFEGRRIYRELRYKTLREFLSTIEGIEIDQPGLRVWRNR